MTEKDKKKKKPKNGEKEVSATKIPKTNSGYKPTGKQVELAKKVQKKGINNSRAYTNKEGKVVAKKDKGAEEKVRKAKVFLDKQQPGSMKYKENLKKYNNAERELKRSNRRSKQAAEVGSAQKNMYNKDGGKGDSYINRLKKNQENKKKVRIKKKKK
jgi:hypothetical protein